MININFLHNYPPFARLLKEIKKPEQSKYQEMIRKNNNSNNFYSNIIIPDGE